MIQLRKKDYLQRLIDEFFDRLNQLKDGSKNSLKEKNNVIIECFAFFYENFGIEQTDSLNQVLKKINDIDLLEQYAKALFKKYEIVDIKDTMPLYLALDIILYVESADKTFSWNRTILKEDLLRLLSAS